MRSCHPAPPLHYSLQFITIFSFSTKVPFHILSSLPLHYMTTGSIPIPQPAHTIHFQLLQVHATALPLNHLSHTGMPNFILPFLSFPFLFFFDQINNLTQILERSKFTSTPTESKGLKNRRHPSASLFCKTAPSLLNIYSHPFFKKVSMKF